MSTTAQHGGSCVHAPRSRAVWAFWAAFRRHVEMAGRVRASAQRGGLGAHSCSVLASSVLATPQLMRTDPLLRGGCRH